MKMKGIPVWEQYLEFIVLGVAVIVFATLAAMQFVGNPNAVEDPRRGIVGPGDVDEVLEQEAERLRPYFEPNAPAPVDIPTPEPVLPQFEQRLASGVSPDDSITIPQLAFAPATGSTVVITDVAFVEPEIAAPFDLVTQQYFDALEPSVVAEHEALQQRFPAQPYDVTWITAAASFDVAQALQEFRRTGPDGIPAPVPPSWYGNRVTILDVVIERQQQVNGGWTDQQVVATLPGRFTVRPRLDDTDLTPADRDDMQQQLLAGRLMAEIVQPEFYSTRNASWYPPTEQKIEEIAPDITDEQRRILRLQNELSRTRNELNRVVQLLDEAGGELYGDDDRRPSGGDGDGGASGGGGARPPGGGMAGGSGAGRRTPGGEAAERRTENQRRTLTQRRDQLLADVQRVEDQLNQLGAQVAVDDDIEAGFDPFSQDVIRMWGHDMDITPGVAYRYRFTVRVLNPYFKRDVHLLDDQKHLAESIAIASLASDWSHPVTAKPPLEVFVVNATAPVGTSRPGKLGLGQSSVEIYRFYDGRWWQERFAVEPGQRIGEIKQIRAADAGQPVNIDFGTDWYVLDIVSDLDADAASDRGRAAAVLLQSITYPDVLVWRHPNRDVDALRRQELEERVRLAELGGGVQASAASP